MAEKTESSELAVLPSSAIREELEKLVLADLHDPAGGPDEEGMANIAWLWTLSVEMDQTVAANYGCSDLNLGHSFHETKQGVRYTISDSACRAVLDRLLALNHQRYAEEVKAGLHDKKRGAGGGKRGPGKGKKTTSSDTSIATQGDLFG